MINNWLRCDPVVACGYADNRDPIDGRQVRFLVQESPKGELGSHSIRLVDCHFPGQLPAGLPGCVADLRNPG